MVSNSTVSKFPSRVSWLQVSASLVSAFAKDLGVPEDKAQLKFQKPDGVEIVGSYAVQTVAKPFQTVDLAVRLPKVRRFFFWACD